MLNKTKDFNVKTTISDTKTKKDKIKKIKESLLQLKRKVFIPKYF